MKTDKGYIRFCNKKDCIYSDKKGRVFEHRYVWWKEHGNNNLILSNEVLHHINGNKSDNRLENLEKMSEDIHVKKHHKKNPEEIKLNKKIWRLKNKDKLNQKRRELRKSNPLYLQTDRKYRERNKERINSHHQKYREKYRDKINKRSNVWYHAHKIRGEEFIKRKELILTR